MATAIALVVFSYLGTTQPRMLYDDGDSLLPVLVIKSLQAGEAQDWAMSPVLFLPELVIYGALSVLGWTIRETLSANAVVNFVLLYAALRVVSGRRNDGNREPVIAALVGFGAFCVLAVLDASADRSGFALAFELAMTTHYSATLLAAVLAVGLVRRAMAHRVHTTVLLLGLSLLSGVSALTNPLYVVWLVLPTSAVLVLLTALQRISIRRSSRLVVVLTVGSLLGLLLRLPLSPWIVADGKDYVRIDRWATALGFYAEQLVATTSTVTGAISFGVVLGLWLASGATALLGIRSRRLEIAFLGVCGFVAPLIAFAGLVATGTEAARYMQPWAFFPVVALTAAVVGWIRWPNAKQPNILAAAAACMLALTALISLPRAAVVATAVDEDLRCVVQWIDLSQRTGAGQFWSARAPKAYARDQQHVIQVDHRLNVYTWLTNRADRHNAVVTYLVTDNRSQPFDYPIGVSESTATQIDCGRYTILDFYPLSLPLGPSHP